MAARCLAVLQTYAVVHRYSPVTRLCGGRATLPRVSRRRDMMQQTVSWAAKPAYGVNLDACECSGAGAGAGSGSVPVPVPVPVLVSGLGAHRLLSNASYSNRD
jgi:hypothetical protein